MNLLFSPVAKLILTVMSVSGVAAGFVVAIACSQACRIAGGEDRALSCICELSDQALDDSGETYRSKADTATR